MVFIQLKQERGKNMDKEINWDNVLFENVFLTEVDKALIEQKIEHYSW